MSRKKLTVHQRIMRAAKNCTGMRLSPDEVYVLSLDDAISTCAMEDDEAGSSGRGSAFYNRDDFYASRDQSLTGGERCGNDPLA